MSFRAERGISHCAEVSQSSRRPGAGWKKEQTEIPRFARNDTGEGSRVLARARLIRLFQERFGAARNSSAQPIDAVEGRSFIALRQRGVVEHIVDEVIDLAPVGQHRLTDVDDFAGVLTDDMHS